MASSRLAERFPLADFAYAHRGLWSANGPTENSLEAFLLAAEYGLGIEFDVRPTADGVPVIFHDSILERMTGLTGLVERQSSEALIGELLEGGGAILSLAALLDHWPTHLPLLCELKVDGSTHPEAFAETVSNLLLAYSGAVAAMSFSPEAVAALPKTLMRGQLILPTEMTGETHLNALVAEDVDYAACHIRDAGNATLQHARAQRPLIAWTVKDEETCKTLAPLTDSQIFEGFGPALAKRHILNT